MPIEPKLREFPEAPVKMGHEFFRSIRDRIETIAPIPTESGGKGQSANTSLIKVEYVNDEGCKITFNGSAVTLTVCSNGVPTELVVLSPK